MEDYPLNAEPPCTRPRNVSTVIGDWNQEPGAINAASVLKLCDGLAKAEEGCQECEEARRTLAQERERIRRS